LTNTKYVVLVCIEIEMIHGNQILFWYMYGLNTELFFLTNVVSLNAIYFYDIREIDYQDSSRNTSLDHKVCFFFGGGIAKETPKSSLV